MRLRRKQAKPLHINDITIIDDEKLKKPLPLLHWVMQWSGLILVYMDLWHMHLVRYFSPAQTLAFR